MTHRASRSTAAPAAIFALAAVTVVPAVLPQALPPANGARVVHNELPRPGAPGPRIRLELVRAIGDIDSEDDATSFNIPSDVLEDSRGHVFILDSMNARIQEFGPDGQFVGTTGRKGQGPGEFVMPDSLSRDAEGRLVVYDMMQRRITLLGGPSVKMIPVEAGVAGARALAAGGYVGVSQGGMVMVATGAPGKASGPAAVMKVLDAAAKPVRGFGDLADFGDPLSTTQANSAGFDVAAGDEVVLAFRVQNRVERYDADGKLLWRADRPLGYKTEMKAKAEQKAVDGGMMFRGPDFNSVSGGVAVDGRGRAWVATYARQLRKEEQVRRMMTMSDRGGGGAISTKTDGDQEMRNTDAFRLDVFGPDGTLVAVLPLDHFVDAIRFSGTHLYLIDKDHRSTVYQYRIIEP